MSEIDVDYLPAILEFGFGRIREADEMTLEAYRVSAQDGAAPDMRGAPRRKREAAGRS